MANKLVRVTFDAVKSHETDKGVCYYRSNDRANKETIIRKSQIVQEIEIGLEDKRAVAERELKRLRGDSKYWHEIYRHYSISPGDHDVKRMLDNALRADERIAVLTEYLANYRDSESRLDNERYEWCVMDSTDNSIHRGPMSKEDAVEWVKEWVDMTRPNDVFYVARRPIGEWERYEY